MSKDIITPKERAMIDGFIKKHGVTVVETVEVTKQLSKEERYKLTRGHLSDGYNPKTITKLQTISRRVKMTKEAAAKELGITQGSLKAYLVKGKVRGDGKGGVSDESVKERCFGRK